MEEDYGGGETTELAELALAVKNLKQVSSTGPTATTKKQPEVFRLTLPNKFASNNGNNSTVAIVSRFTLTTPSPHPIYTVTVSRSKTRYSTTVSPLALYTTTPTPRKRKPQPFQKIKSTGGNVANTFRPLSDYDYYDDIQASILARIPEHSKVLLHSNGVIECLDQGNFPHPISCKKFISCAKMENGKVLGWEYTCPKNLSFDPIGGICNWSAGLGCSES